MSDLISIIIPIYNAAQYLDACIQSVLMQTYKNYELILINDGSTDKSTDICNYYSNNYPNIKIIHKENGGVSSARNTGLENAKGNYICFIDADDLITISYLEDLIKYKQYDIVISGNYVINEHNIVVETNSLEYRVAESITDRKNFILDMDPTINLDVLWAKLFKRSIIDASNLRFDPELQIGEDKLFVLDYLVSVNNIIQIIQTGYNYRSLSASIIRNPLTFYQRLNLIKKITQSYNKLENSWDDTTHWLSKRSNAFSMNQLTFATFEIYNKKESKSERVTKLKKIFRKMDLENIVTWEACWMKKHYVIFFLYKINSIMIMDFTLRFLKQKLISK